MTEGQEPGVDIRRATAADFDALVDLDIGSAEHHAALDPAGWRVPAREAAADFLRRRQAADPDRATLVATVDGRVVGGVEIGMEARRDPGGAIRDVPTADLGITVLPDHRGQGIGERLMAAAEDWAREQGAERIVLDLSAANEGARRFYERLGYEVHGLLMRRSLK